MKYAVLIFPDKASQNIKSHLNPSIPTHFVKKRCVDAENIDREIKADLFIFATTHTSKSGIPSLSVHAPGNFTKAEVGGISGKLPPCNADFLRKAYLTLKKLNTSKEYETILECTHHGPYLNKPSIFIEIGSGDERWGDPEAGKIIAKVIEEIISTPTPESSTPTKERWLVSQGFNQRLSALGFGGLHACPELSKVLERSNLSLGHICPKYNLEHLDKEMLQQMIKQTHPTPKLAILDWKGLGPQKERITSLLEEIKMPYKKTKDFSRTED